MVEPITICSFTSDGGNEKDYEICLEAKEIRSSNIEVRLKIIDNSASASNNIEIPIEIDLTQDEVTIRQHNFLDDKYAACLGLCGLGSLVQEIIKCKRQCKNNNNNTRQCVISCLRAKGHDLGDSLTNCAIACIAS
ncbi:MAG: hypothetical protein AAF298_02200 [Cyanobacteria bacterium P01_A01_bin.40]